MIDPAPGLWWGGMNGSVPAAGAHACHAGPGDDDEDEDEDDDDTLWACKKRARMGIDVL